LTRTVGAVKGDKTTMKTLVMNIQEKKRFLGISSPSFSGVGGGVGGGKRDSLKKKSGRKGGREVHL